MNANIAIAVKDESEVDLDASHIERNVIGVDMYNKNWRYQNPGRISIAATSFKKNSIDIKTQKQSKVFFDKMPPKLKYIGALTFK